MIPFVVGNRRFKICIENHLHKFIEASCKKSKSYVVTIIVNTIRASSQAEGGGFIRKDRLNKRWYEVKDKIAREKVGQALRDASVDFLKNKEEDGSSVEASSSIPALAPESPRKGSLAPRDTPAKNDNLLETEANKCTPPEPVFQSNLPGWSTQSPRKRTYESVEVEAIVTPTSMKQVVYEEDSSVGPSSDLIDNQNRPQIMKKSPRSSSSSMMDKIVMSANNLKQDWMPVWAPSDFEPTPLFEPSTALKNVCVSRQA